MELSTVGKRCHHCSGNDFLPVCCGGCFHWFCGAHSVQHDCGGLKRKSAEQLVQREMQDMQALERLCELIQGKIVVNALKHEAVETKFRTLSVKGNALKCLAAVLGGEETFFISFGWKRDGDFLTLAVPDDGTLDWRASLRSLEQFCIGVRRLIQGAPKVMQSFQYFCVLDFEATCQDGPTKLSPQEVIELPVVLLDARTMKVVAEFHRYVRPTHHPKLTAFCTQLTGIKQATVDAADVAERVFTDLEEWLVANNLLDAGTRAKKTTWTWVTCGDWDLRSMLPNQWKLFAGRRHIPAYFDDWINLKIAFSKFYPGRSSSGMAAMLESLGLPLVGHHHSGIDDSRNICAIVQRMLKDGNHFVLTTWRSKGKKK